MNRKTHLLAWFYLFFVLYLFVMFFLLSSQVVRLSVSSLQQWMTRVFPALFPFMMLNSCIILLGVDQLLAQLCMPFFQHTFHTSVSGCYIILSGFLFGFPMGAKVTSQFYIEHRISKIEADTLLCFCNTFSPAYYKGFVFPALIALYPHHYGFFILCLYAIPIGYGILLCHMRRHKMKESMITGFLPQNQIKSSHFFIGFQSACQDNLVAIGMIGANMIIANTLLCILYPIPLRTAVKQLISSSFEITSGLPLIYQNAMLSTPQKAIGMLTLLSFGGLSGLFQSFHFIVRAGLSIKSYLFHKCMLVLITFFLCILLCSLF